MTELDIPSPASLEIKAVWQSLAEAHRYLAERKGLCESLPNRAILFDTLAIQEAKDSSEIENIITTHDELYAYDQSGSASPAAKEVQNYIAALKVGFTDVVNSGLIRISTILRVQAQVEQNNAGFRKLPGTVLKNQGVPSIRFGRFLDVGNQTFPDFTLGTAVNAGNDRIRSPSLATQVIGELGCKIVREFFQRFAVLFRDLPAVSPWREIRGGEMLVFGNHHLELTLGG